MIPNLSEINHEIELLECKPQTFPAIEKLAVLYIIRDHNERQVPAQEPQMMPYSRRSAVTGSEFKKAAMSIDMEKLVDIMDEHMEVLKALYPKEYDVIMHRIIT